MNNAFASLGLPSNRDSLMPYTRRYAVLSALIVLSFHPFVVGAPPVSDDALQSAGLIKYWDLQLPMIDGDAVHEAYLVDGTLYISTKDGLVFSVTAAEGLIRWVQKLADRNYRILKPNHMLNRDGTGPVIISTSQETNILDRYTGKALASFETSFVPSSSAVGINDAVFMGGTDGKVYSMQWLCTGSRKPLLLWEVLSGGPVTSTPVLHDGDKLLFASQGGVVASCFSYNKAFNWRTSLGGGVSGDPVVDADGVYVPCEDRSLYKLDLKTGSVIWRHRTTKPLDVGPVVARDTIYQACPGVGMLAIDAGTGKELWRLQSGQTLAAQMDGNDLIYRTDNTIDIVDRRTGKPHGSIKLDESSLVVANKRTDAAFVVSKDGSVLCARPKHTPHLRPSVVSTARRNLNQKPTRRKASLSTGASTGDGNSTGIVDPLRSPRDSNP